MKNKFFSVIMLLLISFTLHSEEDIEQTIPLTDSDGLSSTLIGGCVSAISGHYVESFRDVILPGPGLLTFERFYSSGDDKTNQLHQGWKHNLVSYITKSETEHEEFASCTEPAGRQTVFKRIIREGKKFFLSSYYNKGLTNLGYGKVSAKTNLKNTTIEQKDGGLLMITGDNTQRFYKMGHVPNKEHRVLLWEKNPNGNRVIYHYDENGRVIGVEAQNKNGKSLGKIDFIDIYDDLPKNDAEFIVEASTGQKAAYNLKYLKEKRYDSTMGRIDSRHCISKVFSPSLPPVTYKYANYHQSKRIVKRSFPENRNRWIRYYTNGKQKVLGIPVHISYHEGELGRVKQLLAPVGTDKKPVVTHTFFYKKSPLKTKLDPDDLFTKSKTKKKEKSEENQDLYTVVLDAYHYKTTYGYTKDHCLHRICKFKGMNPDSYSLYTKEHYVWGEDASQNEGRLLCKTLEDGEGRAIAARVFEYDLKGNVLVEKYYGNLTGHSKPLQLNEKGLPIENGVDCDISVFAYIDDERNLLKTESKCNGKTISYDYVPGTNLLKAKFVLDCGSIIQREFYEYDEDAVLTKKILDDGINEPIEDLSGVTERHITQYALRTSQPFGLAECIEEKILNTCTGEEILLKKIRQNFSPEGRLLEQTHYDNAGTLCATLSWEYDAHGNVIRQVDALGQNIIKKYDANDNLIFEKGPRLDCHKEYRYDFSNRLIRSEEVYDDGTRLCKTFGYDYLGNCIKSTDTSGNETLCTYDEFKRCIAIQHPPIVDMSGKLQNPTSYKAYDHLGNVTGYTNPRGEKTTTTYTVRGQPVHTIYPDGTEEWKKYHLDGTLKESISRNGMISQCTYDVLGRVLKTENYSSDQKLISCTSSTYNGFHQTSFTNEGGLITKFSYDFAGRLVQEISGERKKVFEYDAQGRLWKTNEWFGPKENDYLSKVTGYDVLNRIISEAVIDANSKTLTLVEYNYDADGNQSETIHYSANGKTSTAVEFNPSKLPIKTMDAEGNISQIFYDYNYVDPYGQRVLKITTVDPMGIQTVNLMNALEKPSSTFKLNSLGRILTKKELFYDGMGNCLSTSETVVSPNALNRIIKTLWSYDCMGNLLSVIEAVGTPEEKSTRYIYNQTGQKCAIIKPDGTRIDQMYDCLGRISTISASDHSFSYAYVYDLKSNILQVRDLIHNTVTTRSYDFNDRLIKEVLGNGIEMQYGYDRMGRKIRQILPDGSKVLFGYDPLFLKSVTRMSQVGEVLYTHVYDSYDLSGNLLSSKLIGNAGKFTQALDGNGRVKKIAAPFWSEYLEYDPVGNLIKEEFKDQLGTADCYFSYNGLNQLKQESGICDHIYQTDSVYNFIEKDGKPCLVNALNQLLQDDNGDYTYDENGNLIGFKCNGKQITYAYDAWDRLTTVKEDAQVVNYSYDAFNRRLSKTICKGEEVSKIHYLYQEDNEIGSCDSEKKIVELRILGEGKGAEIGAAVAVELQGQVFATIHNHNGNVLGLVDFLTGEIKEFYRYSAYGIEEVFDANNQILQSSLNPWRFASKRFDIETGFLYFGRRYYNPTTGKWISADPAGFTGGSNLYSYVLNNPLTHFDLRGLIIQEIVDAVYSAICEIGGAIRDFGSRCCNYISGHPEVTWNDHYEDQYPVKSKVFDLNVELPIKFQRPEAPPGLFYSFTNGIATSFNHCKGHADHLSEILRGINLGSTYNASQHPISDFFRAIVDNLFYRAREPSRLKHQEWDAFFEKAGTEALFVDIAHSNGCTVLRNSLETYDPEKRKRIAVLAVAPASFIDPSICHSVLHLCSITDIVWMGDPLGIVRCWDTIKFLCPSSEISLFRIDHGFQSPTYRKPMKNYLRTFLNSEK